MNELEMFRRGRDTLAIAWKLRTTEAEVYNAIARQREEERKNKDLLLRREKTTRKPTRRKPIKRKPKRPVPAENQTVTKRDQKRKMVERLQRYAGATSVRMGRAEWDR